MTSLDFSVVSLTNGFWIMFCIQVLAYIKLGKPRSISSQSRWLHIFKYAELSFRYYFIFICWVGIVKDNTGTIFLVGQMGLAAHIHTWLYNSYIQDSRAIRIKMED